MNIIKKINSAQYLSEDGAKLILRLAVGGTVLLHGWFKVVNPETVGFIASLFAAWHLPAFLAYLVYIGEVVAPAMLILGWQTKIASMLVAVTMIVAVVLVHLSDIFALNDVGGWGIELQALMLFGAVAIYGLGAGRYSLDAKSTRETVTIP